MILVFLSLIFFFRSCSPRPKWFSLYEHAVSSILFYSVLFTKMPCHTSGLTLLCNKLFHIKNTRISFCLLCVAEENRKRFKNSQHSLCNPRRPLSLYYETTAQCRPSLYNPLNSLKITYCKLDYRIATNLYFLFPYLAVCASRMPELTPGMFRLS